MAFVVEITNRSGGVLERHRIEGEAFTVGRGFDNHIIVSDPYVDVHHCVIEQVEDAAAGTWRVRVLPGATPPQLDGRRLEDETGRVVSGSHLILGRTQLRIYAPDHPVEPVLLFDRIEQLFVSLATPAGVFWSVTAFAALLLGDLWLRSWHELEASSIIQELFGSFGLSIGWAAFWAVVARISRGEPRFFHHWSVAAMAVAINIVGEFLIDVIAFNTASVETRDVLSKLLTGLCLAFALTLNLRFSLRQSVVARHAWAQGFAWAVVGYGILTSMQFEAFFSGAPEYDGTVMPELWRVASAVPAEAFVEDNAALFEFPQEDEDEEEEDEKEKDKDKDKEGDE